MTETNRPDSELVQANAIIEAMLMAARGEPVSDFMASFGPVREVLDLYAEVRYHRKAPDPLGEALNSGNGSYRP